jgi:2,5-diamino-6-(ribosylamino)-4(3H)-pyrimidinone 5'-phosphate reductase
MRPQVVVHAAVSLDGATTGFTPDIGRFYELAAGFHEDVTLTGADTILAQEANLEAAPKPGPAPDGPLLAVVDGRGRVSRWAELRDVGHWSDVLALYCATTPPRPAADRPAELVTGTDRVDLPAVVDALGRRDGVATIRVDSGGALTGALLRVGLIDEISLLVHPVLAGPAGDRRWYGPAPPSDVFTLVGSQIFDGGLVWCRYRRTRISSGAHQD